ncbi:LytR/AlgR family response regulator transcription factor [Algoriphagus hitonicola]|uniref:Two component transcriptional regulator, LytTR family n=1 Tax=Algoriphagus hitonicola TaxID=435880 RepID=A0A1I2XKK2_9BACT|nr:LytTR family DNA-binding domain-containing protein [Algoriphagus hitonicola]SFH13549.1 two component transcriptional regulator, LytTR family [Algoriphagus hitonicola]
MNTYFHTERPKILILEDEPLVADGLKKHILDLIPSAEILPILSSVKKAINWFEQSQITDLIFADIQLSDGISFDIFQRFEPPCPVIFTTAFNHYAIRAFEVNSVDFLLKPIEKTELKLALEKLGKRRASFAFPDLSTSLQQSQKGTVYLKRILATTQNSLVPITEEEIVTFIKEELIFVIIQDGKRLLTDFQSLDELEKALDPSLFFRANRQCILRIDSVKQIKSNFKGLEVQLKTSSLPPIPISKERSTIFKKWILGKSG